MNSEDIITRYKEKVLEVSRADLDLSEVNQGLAELSETIADELMIDNFLMKEEVINGNRYIKYSFMHNTGICSSAIKVDYNTLAHDIAEHIGYIVNGIEAIDIINSVLRDYLSNNASGYELEAQWGFGKYCTLSYWDYDNAIIRLSKNSVMHIVNEYYNGKSTFRQNIEALMSDELIIDTIVKLLNSFNNLKLSNYIEAKLPETSLDDILSKNMIQRDDAISIIRKNKACKAVQNILVLNIVNQLGDFAILQNWKVDYRNKVVNTSIVDNKILDLEDGAAVTNESLCMRIEHLLDLDEKDVISWFE